MHFVKFKKMFFISLFLSPIYVITKIFKGILYIIIYYMIAKSLINMYITSLYIIN